MIDDLYEESIKSKIGEKIRKLDDDRTIKKIWNNRGGKLRRGVYESNKITDKDFDEFKNIVHHLKNDKYYSEYKKSFDRLCKMCMISPDGCIIQRIDLQKGKKPDTNYVLVCYSNTRQKITIPQGSRLYHTSVSEKAIKELQPFFRGKPARGFFYSAPRVYLTIKDDMTKAFMDIAPGTATRTYVTKENIRSAYIDPLVPKSKHGAVYVETNFPIPVTEIVPVKKKEKSPKLTKESYDFVQDDEININSLEEFLEYYGLEFADDDEVIKESFNAAMGHMARKKMDYQYFKNLWRDRIGRHEFKKKTVPLNEKQYKKLLKDYETLQTSKDYIIYKRAYEDICKFFTLKLEYTSIKGINFDLDLNTNDRKAIIEYYEGKRKIIIPNDTTLIHTSKEGNIKELKPSFCSKVKGLFMWPSKRVYFSLGKKLSADEIHERNNTGKLYHYTPAETIRTAYIDPEITNFNSASVYVDTSFPIKVINIDKGIIGSVVNNSKRE